MQTSSSAVIALLLLVSTFGWGQSPSAHQSTLQVGGRTFVFKNVSAFSAGDKEIVAIFTPGRLAAKTLAELKTKEPTESSDFIINGPYLKLVFNSDGQPTAAAGHAGSSMFLTSKGLEGSIQITGARLKGRVTLTEEGDFAKSIDAVLDTTLVNDASPDPLPLDPPVTPTVKGTFTGNGKGAKLAFVSVQPHEEFNDQKAITLIFTEKDHSKDPKPSIKSAFGEYGSALILSVTESGGIFGCEVAHSAHSKTPFTALGKILMEEFDMTTGNAVGHVTTPGELDAFGEKWQVDLTFAAPLPPAARKMLLAQAHVEKPTATEKPKTSAPKPAGPRIAARSLPLPKSAKNVEFKDLVQQVTFSTPGALPAVVEEFTKGLQAAGWKRDANPLVTAKSAIVKFTHGAGKLTVMAKPAPPGTGVIIFTENLDWGQGKGSDQTEAEDDAEMEEEEDIEKEALDTINKALQDALGDE